MTTRTGWLLGLLCAACAEAGPAAEIRARRTASAAYMRVVPGAGSSERFGESNLEAAGSGSDDLAEMIDFDLPVGWRRLQGTKDRLVNLQPAGNPEASCYLSFLGGSGGGLADNVNRWRTQLGAGPLSGDEIAALPTHGLLGREGTLIEIDGAFKGMDNGAPRAGFRLLGLAVCEPSGSLFLKFIGPVAIVAAEREAYLAFASSLRIVADQHDHAAGGSGTGGGAPMSGAQASGALSWTAPAGWTQGAPRAQREVTFEFGGGECYVTLLPGPAGGLQANLDRWSGQFGGAALTPEDVAALPRVEVLGVSVPVIELTGAFRDMNGAERPKQSLLGVACCRADESLFVKLIGPRETVLAQRENFLAFVASLREGS